MIHSTKFPYRRPGDGANDLERNEKWEIPRERSWEKQFFKQTQAEQTKSNPDHK